MIATSIGCEKIEELKNTLTQKTGAKSASSVRSKTASSAKNMSANTLARVGDWTITKEEFNERLDALKEAVPEYDLSDSENRRLVLDELVRQQLLVLDAEKRGVAKDKDIIAAVEEFRRTLIVREVAANLTEGINVTKEEAKQFYEEQKDILKEPEQWRVREIVVETQIEANELLLGLLKGDNFEEVAKLNSISTSASSGGDLGFLTEEPFPEMVNALINLKEGEISSVFKGPQGYYIVKLDEIKGGAQISYQEIEQDIIRNRTLIKQQQAILDYIDKLEEQIPVEINEALLN
jgi:peptidyl-prolyl cis-trans isomerase C